MNGSDGGTADSGQTPAPARSGPRASYPAPQSSRSRRRWFIGLSVLVVVVGVALATLGYVKFSTPDVSGEASGYELIDSSTVAVQFTVTRADPARPAACVVRGRSRDGSETGRREILIPAGTQAQVGFRTQVRTSAPPVIGEVFGCTTDVPAYLQPASR